MGQPDGSHRPIGGSLCIASRQPPAKRGVPTDSPSLSHYTYTARGNKVSVRSVLTASPWAALCSLYLAAISGKSPYIQAPEQRWVDLDSYPSLRAEPCLD